MLENSVFTLFASVNHGTLPSIFRA